MSTGEKIALAVGLYWLYVNGYLNGLLQSLQSALQGTINVTNPASAGGITGYHSEGTNPLFGPPPGAPTFPAPENPLFTVAPSTQNPLVPVLPGGWSFQPGVYPQIPALGTPSNPVGPYGATVAPGASTFAGGINSGGPGGFGRGGSPFQTAPFSL